MRDVFDSGTRLDRVIALRSLAPEDTLTADDFRLIAERSSERSYAAGDVITQQGQPFKEMFFVTRGTVRIMKDGQTIQLASDRDEFGFPAALSGDPDGYETVAETDASVLGTPIDVFWDIFEDNFEVVRQVLAGLGGRVLAMRQALGPNAGFTSSDWIPTGSVPQSMDLVDRILFFRKAIPMGNPMLEAVLSLAQEAEPVRVRCGEDLWKLGDHADSFVLPVWGLMSIHNPDGLDVRLGPGDSLGYLGGVTRGQRWYTATAATEFVGLRHDFEHLMDVFEDHANLAAATASGIAQGLVTLMNLAPQKIPDFSQLPRRR